MSELSAASPLQEYVVHTTDGRKLVWSASDMDSLFRQLTYRGHQALKVQLFSEYEAEQRNIEGQQDLHHEHNERIEKGDAA